MITFDSHSSSAFPWYLQFGGALLAVGILLGVHAGPDHTGASSSSMVAVHTAGMSLSPADEGERIYNTRCMSCHQMGGRGVPGTFPPLRDTDWVNGDKGRLIRFLLNGLSGTIEVKGQTYSGVMPPWGGALDDEGLAAVATYIRSNFGNDASAVTAEEVAKVRTVTKGRKKPWTAKELKKEANMGIPGDSVAVDE